MITLIFRRNIDTPERMLWGELKSELEGIKLSNEEDSVRWVLTPHGQFTTSCLYRQRYDNGRAMTF
jgi:hypothetical protein